MIPITSKPPSLLESSSPLGSLSPPGNPQNAISLGITYTCKMPASQNLGGPHNHLGFSITSRIVTIPEAPRITWGSHVISRPPTISRMASTHWASHHLLEPCIISKNPFPLGHPSHPGCFSPGPLSFRYLSVTCKSPQGSPSSQPAPRAPRCRPLTRWLPRRQQPG